jgi:hypothetical protein
MSESGPITASERIAWVPVPMLHDIVRDQQMGRLSLTAITYALATDAFT